ncbi:MAG: hypothetical protein HOO98_11625, partial [Nitrospira sp.]|nr:hypothetical protein [Nitrospira sp.]
MSTRSPQSVTRTMVVACWIIGTSALMHPCGSWADDIPPGLPSSIVSTPDVGPLQEDDDVDPNLVPLEPELTLSPSDLSSTEDKPEQLGDATAQGTTNTNHQNTVYNIPVVMDQSVQSHIHFFNTSIRSRFEQW